MKCFSTSGTMLADAPKKAASWVPRGKTVSKAVEEAINNHSMYYDEMLWTFSRFYIFTVLSVRVCNWR
jgi:hypothetical protein